MKVFWAWQADLPGKISRHFIRSALEEAIDRLKQPRDIEEPPEESRRDSLHLDYDTKGLKGAPEVAHEIFTKIAAAAVVVADVTPIGRGPDRPDKDGKPQEPKPLMNPNVAIELGYAFGKLGTESFLPILNKAYGDESSLPFDIIHRRHPIAFNLSENATKAAIEREKKNLVEQLVTALGAYLTDEAGHDVAPRFNAAQAKKGKAAFFSDGEELARIERSTITYTYTMPFQRALYMRIYPCKPLDGNLDIHRIKEAVNWCGQFGQQDGTAIILENKYGVIVGSVRSVTFFVAVLQYFRTGEIWGVNTDILNERDRYLYTELLESIFIDGLRFAMQFHKKVGGIGPPFRVEVGLVGCAGWKIAHIGFPLDNPPVLASDEITHSAVLNQVDEQTQRSFLMAYFEKLNKDSGVPRPKGLYGR